MTTLDRMLLRQFFINVVALAVVILVLILTIDLLANGDEFVSAGALRGATWLDHTWGTLASAADYYSHAAMLYLLYLVGLIVAGGALFTAVTLVRNREYAALLAAGVSRRRVTLPLLAGVLGFNLLGAATQEWVAPRFINELLRGPTDMKAGGAHLSIDFLRDSSGGVVSAKSFEPASQTLTGFVYLRRDAAGRITSHIEAERATWEATPGVWRLTNGREFIRAGLATDKPASIADVATVSTDLSPRLILFSASAKARRFMSSGDLLTMSPAAPLRAEALRQLIQGRRGLLVANTAMALIGLTILLCRVISLPDRSTPTIYAGSSPSGANWRALPYIQ